MLIDSTYFIGEINIAGTNSPAVLESLNLFIGKRETEFLEKVLGYGFANDFAAGLAADPAVARWTDLKTGAEYNNECGYLKKWKGFTNAALQSPIANYIYYWYMRDLQTFTSTVGEMESKSDNAGNADSSTKMIRAYNEAVSQVKVLHDFLLNKKDEDGALVYPEFAIKETECFESMSWL
jgi:hypothetical protein